MGCPTIFRANIRIKTIELQLHSCYIDITRMSELRSDLATIMEQEPETKEFVFYWHWRENLVTYCRLPEDANGVVTAIRGLISAGCQKHPEETRGIIELNGESYCLRAQCYVPPTDKHKCATIPDPVLTALGYTRTGYVFTYLKPVTEDIEKQKSLEDSN